MARLSTKIRRMALVCAMGLMSSNAASAADGDALKLAWTYETGKPTNIAPVVAGDIVLTVPEGGPLLAFDATTGKVKWQFAPKEGVWDRGFSSIGEQVFACIGGGKLVALNRADGAPQWTVDLGINCQRPAYFADDAIFVSTTQVGPGLPADPLTGATFFSINRADGRINWSFVTDDFLLQTATGFGDTVYVAGNYHDPKFTSEEGGPARYYAIDKTTGKVKWTHVSVEGTPKALYATQDRLTFIAYQDFAYGLDAATGKVLWKRDTENWVPSLIGEGDVIYLGSANTFVHAWSTKDGQPVWRYNVPGGAFDYLLIKPVIDGDKLYFMSQRGFVYGLDKATGKQLWSHATGMNSRVGIGFGNGYLYMGDKYGRFYAFKIMK